MRANDEFDSKDLLRMFHWLLITVVLYGAAVYFTHPQIQTGLWKAGHITFGAFIGYWIDRQLLCRVDHKHTSEGRLVARAIVVGAAVLGMAFGL